MTVLLANNVTSTLASAITASATSLVVSSNADKFPTITAGQHYYVTLVSTTGVVEVVKVVSRLGAAMGIVRAQDGTNAVAFAAGSRVELRVNAASVLDAVDDGVADAVATMTLVTDALDTRIDGTATDIAALDARLDTVEAKTAILDSVTASAAEINVLDGTTATTATLNAAISNDTQTRNTVAALLADTALTYATGQVGTVSAGNYVYTRAEGFMYRVAAIGATDHHVTTAGGVKLYVDLTSARIDVRQFGCAVSPADNATALITMRNALIAADRARHWTIFFPPGQWDYTNNRWSENLLNLTIEGYGAKLRCTGTGTFAGDSFPIGPREKMFRNAGDTIVSGGSFSVFTGHRFKTVAAGSLTIELETLADASNYAVGQRVFLYGYTMLRVGYAPTPRFYEWAEIAGISGAVITLKEALTESYNAGWPDFSYNPAVVSNGQSVPEQFIGKPRLVNLDGRLQTDGSLYYYPRYRELRGITFLQGVTTTRTRLNIGSQTLIMRDVSVEEVAGSPAPASGVDAGECEYVLFENIGAVNGLEIDKCLGTVEIIGGRFGYDRSDPAGSSGSIFGGSSLKRLICRGVLGKHKFRATARDAVIVEACEFSSSQVSNSSLQGPVIVSDVSGYYSKYAEISGLNAVRLSAQLDIGSKDRTYSYVISATNTDDILIPWSATVGDPDAVVRRTIPGHVMWLSTDPRIRGTVSALVDDGGGNLRLSFSSGNLPLTIANGGVVAGNTLQGYVTERLIYNGQLLNPPTDIQNPNPGLLNWANFTTDSKWSVNGVVMTGDGTGTSGNFATFFDVFKPGKTYALTYNATRTGGSILIRDSGSATNLATISASGTGVTVTFTVSATAKDMTIRPVSYNGTLTPLKLVEVV